MLINLSTQAGPRLLREMKGSCATGPTTSPTVTHKNPKTAMTDPVRIASHATARSNTNGSPVTCSTRRFDASSDLTTKPAIPGDRCITFDQSCRRSVGEASLQCACSVSMSETSSGRSSLTDTIKESRRTGACNTAPRTRTHPTSRTRKQPLPSNRVTPPGGDSRQRACVKPGEVHPQWNSHGDM